MTIYALVRHSRGLGLQGDNDKFDDRTTEDVLVKYFEERVNQVNNTNDSVVLHLHKLVENEDGTPKLSEEGRQELKVIYVDKQYLAEISSV